MTTDLLPARILNEFVYCPRLAYIEWVQGDFAESADTIEGRTRHKRVDEEGGELPPPESDERIHARSVWLSSEAERLTARIDLIEGEGGEARPVDYKHGALPDIPERAWITDCVQLCAQGLVLRSHGYSSPGGVVYYVASRTRVEIAFDDDLIEYTRGAVRDAFAMAESGVIPPPLSGSPKCPRCSLAGICLPDETLFLSSGGRRASELEEDVRRLLPARDDALPLYVTEQGARVSKRDELFDILSGAKRIGDARIAETSHIGLFGSVQITTPALSECFARGIPVAFFSMGGWFKGIAHGMSHKNVELRSLQFRAAQDDVTCLGLSRYFVSAKVLNSRTLLMRNHSDAPAAAVRMMARMAGKARTARDAGQLLGVEGNAARAYFGAFGGMLKARDEDGSWSFDFEGRNRRPPLDPVNAMLSYAYSLLVKDITVILLLAGFDPYLGFYHRPRYGRPALALDLMEEFRPVIAESVVLWAVNNRVVQPDDFMRRGPSVSLTQEGRRKFLRAYEKRMDALVTHPVFGYRISYRRVLDVQARLLGRFLTGEIKKYPAFRVR